MRTGAKSYIAGARAGTKIMREVIQCAGEVKRSGPTSASFFAWQMGNAQNLVNAIRALGPLTQAQEGAIAAMGEYIHDWVASGDPEDVRWRSMAAMSHAAQQNRIKRLQEDTDSDEAEASARSVGKVIWLPALSTR